MVERTGSQGKKTLLVLHPLLWEMSGGQLYLVLSLLTVAENSA